MSITYAKFNLKIHCSSPYEREIWHYGKANVDHIRKAINEFPWEIKFENNNVNDKVHIFNATIKNILSNYIPHEKITCDDRDPRWINKNIKQLILEKNEAYKSHLRSNKFLHFFNHFQFLQTKLNSLIEESKEKHYARLSKKLLDPQTSPKSYWSISKTFLNNKKIPCIPPLLHQDRFIIDFKEKAEMINNFFADQCSILRNKSELPAAFSKNTHESLKTIDFSINCILTIIRNLDPNKASSRS